MALAGGGDHTCALTTAGGVKCWGWNNKGQLGDGSTTDRYTPVAVSGLASGVVAIAAGNAYTCALTETGGVKCWGYNYYGQLGDGSTTNRLMPVDVSGLTGAVQAITAGAYHTCALATAGTVECWGYNGNGQLGNNTTSNQNAPVAILVGQSLAFAPPITAATGDSLALSATATGAGSVAVGFDTWTPGTCSVSGHTLSITGAAGSLCGVRASRAGGSDGADGTTANAPQQLRLIQIIQGMATPTLGVSSDLNPSSYGQNVTFTASLSGASSPTGNISVCIDATTTDATCTGGSVLCTVAANATPPLQCASATLVAGSHAISAFYPGDANNASATSAALTQQVNQAAQAITNFAPTSVTYSVGGSFTASATGGASGNPVSFASTTPGTCATGGSNGATVNIVSAGTCTLTTNQAGNTNYAAAPATNFNVAIGPATGTITNFAATPPNPTFSPGGTFMLSATGSGSTAPIIFASTSPGVCTVSGAMVSIVAAGTCTLTADQAGDGNYAAAPQVTLAVPIAKADQTITLTSPGNVSLPHAPLNVNPSASSDLPVTLVSNTPSVCSMSGSGPYSVTLNTTGTCTLTASQAGDGNYHAAPDVLISFNLTGAAAVYVPVPTLGRWALLLLGLLLIGSATAIRRVRG